MKAYTCRTMLLTLALLLAVILQVALPLAAASLPNSVQFKVDECLKSLKDAEAELDARNPQMAREPLRVAKARLDSIKEYQSESYDHPDVVAARDRYDALEKRYNEDKDKAAANAGKADEQLRKLEQFRQFSVDAAFPEDLVATQAKYQAAKALIDEIAAVGTDVQLSGYSDYTQTKLRVEVWEKNREKVIDEFIATAKKYTEKNVSREQDWLDLVEKRLADLAKLLPDDPRVGEARTSADTMRAAIRQEQLERAAKVFMRPEKYKGKEANSLRALAKSAVMKKYPNARILKIKLVGSNWGAPEGGLQWTDNTRSSLETRTTQYFSIEVAVKQGQDVMLLSVYAYKAKVNGKMQPARSYVIGSQLMLEKNVK